MTDDSILEQLLQAFAVEAAETLATMEQTILRLERSPDDIELVRTVFRAAHTIKGDAGCVGKPAVAECAHALEDLIQKFNNTGREVNAGSIVLMLRAVDALTELTTTNSNERHPIIDELRSAAASIAEENAKAVSGATHRPESPDCALRRTLRVDIGRLDRLLDLTGEIAVARGRIASMLQSGENYERLLEAFRESDRLQTELQEIVSRARMVPVGPLFRQFARTVRDVGAAHGKLAELIIEGEDVEVDTSVVDQLRDPLTHMIRNAIDHGLETHDERLGAGKNAVGRLTLSAAHDSGTVVIRFSDDGRGLDTRKILDRARTRGMIAEGVIPCEQEILRLIFEPGFSTSDSVNDLSGRGLGMDIVRRHVDSLRGRIDVASIPGAGAIFTIRLPLTLAIINGFAFSVAGETYLIPLDAVVECVELRPELTTCDSSSSGLLKVRDVPLPYLRLRHHFGIEPAGSGREYVIIVDRCGTLCGLAVDAVIGEMQVVIKPLGKLCNTTAGIAGSAVLGSGRVALLLDVATIIEKATGPTNLMAGAA